MVVNNKALPEETFLTMLGIHDWVSICPFDRFEEEGSFSTPYRSRGTHEVALFGQQHALFFAGTTAP
jgi:hypothetical protein